MNRSVAEHGGAGAGRQPVHALRRHRRGGGGRASSTPPDPSRPNRWSTPGGASCGRWAPPWPTGRFRTHMEVSLVNDGPVTILLETSEPGLNGRRAGDGRPAPPPALDAASRRPTQRPAADAGAHGSGPKRMAGVRPRRRSTSSCSTRRSLDAGALAHLAVGVDDGAEAGRRRLQHPAVRLERPQAGRRHLLALHDRQPVRRAVGRVERPARRRGGRRPGPGRSKNTSQEMTTPSGPTGVSSTAGPSPAMASWGTRRSSAPPDRPLISARNGHVLAERHPLDLVVAVAAGAVGLDDHRVVGELARRRRSRPPPRRAARPAGGPGRPAPAPPA